MNLFWKISTQTFWQLISKATTALSTLILLSVITRNYGQSGLGVYTLTLSFLSFFYLASEFGLNSHIVSELTGSDFGKTWNTLLGIRIVLSLIIIPLAVVLALFIPGTDMDFRLAVLLGAETIFFYAVFATANVLFQVRHKYSFQALTTVVGTVVLFASVVGQTYFHQTVPLLLLGYGLGWIVYGAFSLLLVSSFLQVRPIFNIEKSINYLKSVWPITATLLLNIIYFRVDSFMISYYKGLSDVGTYNLAYQIFQNVLVLPTYIMNSIYPILVTEFQTNLPRFVKLVKRSFLLMFLLSILIGLTIYIISPILINLMANKPLSGAIISLQILALSFPAYFCSSILMWLMILLKKYRHMLSIYTFGLILNVGLNFYLIPRLSFIGAALSTAIAEYLILLVLIVILSPKLRR